MEEPWLAAVGIALIAVSPAPALALLTLALLHLLASRMRFLDVMPRSRWLSLAGGASVAYVLVHLLPELNAGQTAVEEEWGGLEFLESHVFLLAMVGLSVFYGVEVASRRSRDEAGTTASVFWLSIASFALYNGLIGYLVLHREEATTASLAFFTAALGVHFVVNDFSLRNHHRAAYDHVGRWVLVASLAVGWTVGELTDISDAALAMILAFVAGGVILNVLKEELPDERRSSFWAFAVGAAGYAALLQLA